MRRSFRWSTLLALLVVAGSCGGSNASTTADDRHLRFAHNDWLAASLNDAVAKQLLERELGYTVELVPAGTSDQFASIANGDLHVSLEVWPGGHAEAIQRYIHDERTIEDGGPLGPLAKVGWFIPTYLLQQHPELATWDGFKVPANVALFQTPESGSKGRFLGGDPKWVGYDQQIIDNLALSFRVVFAGSEDAELAELNAAYKRRQAVVMYFWLPHWAFTEFDLTMVSLPPYSEACYAKAKTNGVDCDYPTDRLFKMMWPGLRQTSPTAYRFLKAMTYATQTQLEMMASVKVGGQTVEQAAATWIAAHESTWRPWVDAARSP